MVSPSRQTVNEWRRLFDKGKPHTGKRNKKSNKNKNKNKIHINRNNNKPQTIQQDLHGRSSLPSWEPFGDTIKKSKISSTVRIGFQNINILTKNKNTTKSKNMLEFMYKNEFDLWLMSEVGLNWHKVDPQDLWFERIREKFGDQSTRSYMAFNSNEQEIAEPLQYGGTG
ncbi:MAG: fructose/tagatose bisphosphate aldolase, partial [Flavobacteriales bacterium]